jgi:hypothetical protein
MHRNTIFRIITATYNTSQHTLSSLRTKKTGFFCEEQGRTWLSSGMLRRVTSYKLTDVSEDLTATIMREMSHSIAMKTRISMMRK